MYHLTVNGSLSVILDKYAEMFSNTYIGKNKSILKWNDIIPDIATVNIPIMPEVMPQNRIPAKVYRYEFI